MTLSLIFELSLLYFMCWILNIHSNFAVLLLKSLYAPVLFAILVSSFPSNFHLLISQCPLYLVCCAMNYDVSI